MLCVCSACVCRHGYVLWSVVVCVCVVGEGWRRVCECVSMCVYNNSKLEHVKEPSFDSQNMQLRKSSLKLCLGDTSC